METLDGEYTLDIEGNLKEVNKKEESEEGLKETGTYVLRDGKLVKGKGEKREQATYSNWYCSNADPEDLMRHREMLDRMNYKGPKWEGIGVPRMSAEEVSPLYPDMEAEKHPSELGIKQGKKEKEFVVR